MNKKVMNVRNILVIVSFKEKLNRLMREDMSSVRNVNAVTVKIN